MLEFTAGMKSKSIRLENVRQNNLKDITVEFPLKKLSVITGLSGSGKSSLAFDTLYAEGQRRYVESLSTYTRQFLEKMPKPDVGKVTNIPPSIALEQRNHVVNSMSTVGTQSEIMDYLRILFSKVGQTHCVNCGGIVRKIDAQIIFDEALGFIVNKKAGILAPLSENFTQKKSAHKSGKTPKIATLFQLLKEQGFRRVLWKKRKNNAAVIDLEETKEFPKEIKTGKLFIVLDRFRIKKTQAVDKELRTRLLDSIEQAIHIGHESVSLVDLDTFEFKDFTCRFACIDCGKEAPVPEPQLLSFNSPMGACPKCNGFGYTLDLDESLIVPDPSKTLKNGAIDPLSKPSTADWQQEMFRFAQKNGIPVGTRYRDLTQEQKQMLWDGRHGDPSFCGIRKCFEYLRKKRYKLHIRVFIRRYQSQTLCEGCNGARLNKEALHLFLRKKNIQDILSLCIRDGLEWFKKLKLTATEFKTVAEVYQQILKRLYFINSVGVGYLSLNRLTKTLSGGEFQRINLATQLGNGLCGTLYILDEPSIGLHAADTVMLIQVLEDLRDQGNSVVIVEHDPEIMKAADWLIELGPAAGRKGGRLINQGIPQKFLADKSSLTGNYLSGRRTVTRRHPSRSISKRKIKITGCRENNLRNINVEFPLERFVVVTGVSGSGKSTLIHKTLYQALVRLLPETKITGAKINLDTPGRYKALYGADQIAGVVLLNQRPIGKSSRSNPATYLKAWDEIRKIYANQVLAIRRGYSPQTFSFNVEGGRCPTCKGEGSITLDMHFMADIQIPCEECDQKRFKKDVLDIRYKDVNIDTLLNSTIDEAYDLFRESATLRRKLGALRDVGLGYLQVGQPAPTLSGGEAQRLKIANALDSQEGQKLLYLFDEPTTGLHLQDIENLLRVLQDLVDDRNSIIMIEHHQDVIAQADYVIDMGPGGGDAGGKITAQGTPQSLIRNPKSITGKMLSKSGYWKKQKTEPEIHRQQEIT